MDNYSLKSNESLLFKANAYDGIEVLLTNFNLVLVKRTKKIFSKEHTIINIYPIEQIKKYNGIPQIKKRSTSVEVFLTSCEIKVNFTSLKDTHKFVNTAFELLTGKSFSTRGAEKVKNTINLVDNTLGIHTVDTVKNIMENGVIDSIFRGREKNKITKSSNNNTIKETAKTFQKSTGETVNISSLHSTETKTEDYSHKIEVVKKMKDLLDAGILTQEEFEMKKRNC